MSVSNRAAWFTLLTLFALACAKSPSRMITAIENVHVVPCDGTQPYTGTVLIQGRRITAAGPGVETPRSARTIDGRGLYLIPGLWDMHLHTSKLRASALPLMVTYGVTGVRDMGGDHEELLAWRRQIESGERVGPRMVIAGPYLESASNVARMRSTPVEEMAEPVERTRVPVGSPRDAGRVVDSLSHLELDFLKIRTFESLDTYLAICEAASAVGLDLVGHTFGLAPEDIQRCGQKSLEHLMYPTLDNLSDDERARFFNDLAGRGVAVVPTLVNFWRTALVPDDVVAAAIGDSLETVEPLARYLSRYLKLDWREQALEHDTTMIGLFRAVYGSNVRDLKSMQRAGVRIMPGTDAAVLNILPGASLHEELSLFVSELGMTPAEALESATRLPAEFLGMSDSLGTIAAGKVADLVLLRGDPLEDIGNVGRIEAVVGAGRVYDRGALDGLLEQVLASDDLRRNDWIRRRN